MGMTSCPGTPSQLPGRFPLFLSDVSTYVVCICTRHIVSETPLDRQQPAGELALTRGDGSAEVADWDHPVDPVVYVLKPRET